MFVPACSFNFSSLYVLIKLRREDFMAYSSLQGEIYNTQLLRFNFIIFRCIFPSNKIFHYYVGVRVAESSLSLSACSDLLGDICKLLLKHQTLRVLICCF
jgi:hypothetical protein